MVDRCAEGWNSQSDTNSLNDLKNNTTKKKSRSNSRKQNNLIVASDHCVSHAKWDSNDVPFWSHSGVLQLGGLAQTRNNRVKSGQGNAASQTEEITSTGFKGCISHLRINDAVSLLKSSKIIDAEGT